MLALGAAGCAASHPARYPNWEPTSPEIPEVHDRARARALLAESREIWRSHEFEAYTYVRATERRPDRVEYTVVAVQGGVADQRALLAVDPGRARPNETYPKDSWGALPELIWRESGKAVGKNPGGAPPLTIDQLYDVCEKQVLGSDVNAAPRLYFHPDGLLEHCGFVAGECDDCPRVSIASVSRFHPNVAEHPLDYLCTHEYGLYPAGAEAPFDQHCTCMAISGRRIRPATAAPPEHEPTICDIDPAACPGFDPDAVPRPPWNCKFLGIPRNLKFRPVPRAIDIGKSEPNAPWRARWREIR
jgi:hypothetical protein